MREPGDRVLSRDRRPPREHAGLLPLAADYKQWTLSFPVDRTAKQHAEHPIGRFRTPGPDIDDAVVQAAPGPNASTTIGGNCPGVGNGDYGFAPNAAPPDTNGVVGATQYVQWVNEMPLRIFQTINEGPSDATNVPFNTASGSGTGGAEGQIYNPGPDTSTCDLTVEVRCARAPTTGSSSCRRRCALVARRPQLPRTSRRELRHSRPRLPKRL